MKKILNAALVLIILLLMVLLLFDAFSSCCFFSENRSETLPGNNTSSTGLNTSADTVLNETSRDNETGSSGSKDGIDPFLQNIRTYALGFGEYLRYDEDEMKIYPAGDERNDISLSVDRTRMAGRISIKDLYSGAEYTLYPKEDSRFLLVSVTAAPVSRYLERHPSPMTRDFSVVDPLGNYSPVLEIIGDAGVVILNDTSHDTMVNERFVIKNIGDIYVSERIFSSLNNVAGSGSVSGWIIYVVPEEFFISEYSFLKAKIGDDEIYWKLHDVLVDLQVRKNLDTGSISISYNGGAEGYLIRSIEAELVRADGSSDSKKIEKADDEDCLGSTEIKFTGTPGETDLLTVKVKRLDGEEYVKYHRWI